jgi:hypothetical protein
MKRYDLEGDPKGRDGWFGGRPPGIKSTQWPRSRNTGLPMVHILTLTLPPEYRRNGPQHHGIALFQAHDVEASEVDGVADLLDGKRTLSPDEKGDAFFAEIARAANAKHPTERVWTEDDIGFALLWLTAEELAGKLAKLPREIRHEDVEDEPCAWDAGAAREPIRLRVVDDPNTGKPPHDTSYLPYFEMPEELQQRLGYAKHHLGGTLTPPGNLDIPDGMTPYVLELNEVGGANLAGGGLLLDLDAVALCWAAG